MTESTQFNQEVKAWAKDRVSDMQREAAKLGIEHRANSPSPSSSIDGITRKTSMRFGVPNKISFKFARHLIFVHKGVGKGTPISKVGTTTRKAKPWFEPPIERNIEQLGDIVANGLGDQVISNFRL